MKIDFDKPLFCECSGIVEVQIPCWIRPGDETRNQWEPDFEAEPIELYCVQCGHNAKPIPQN